MPKRRKDNPDDPANKIGAWIKAARLRRGITQSNLADQLGLSHQQVSKYERYADDISAARLIQIARILKASLAPLFESLEFGFGEAPQTPYGSPQGGEVAAKITQLRSLLDELETLVRNNTRR